MKTEINQSKKILKKFMSKTFIFNVSGQAYSHVATTLKRPDDLEMTSIVAD